MSMVCPRCRQPNDRLLDCPQCKVRLEYHAVALEETPTPRAEEPALWHQTGWAKIIAGLVLAQGLCYGLQNLFLAGLAAIEGEASAEAVWQSLGGLIVLHSLQAVGLLIGGALSGAGQPRGVWCGCFVGVSNGLICILTQRQDSEPLSQILIYATPLLHMAIGALGGGVGMLIWKPSPILPVFETPAAPVATTTSAQASPRWDPLAAPLYLGRICTGVCIVVIGAVWANAILEAVLRYAQLRLPYTSQLQARLVSWEVSALATLLGAGLAGANTFSGLKQGLMTGLGACVIILGVQLGAAPITLETLFITLGSTMVLSTAGGWFGSTLLPPIDPRKRRRLT